MEKTAGGTLSPVVAWGQEEEKGTMGIWTGFVEEATSPAEEERLWEREEQKQRQGVCGVAPGERAGCQDIVCTFSL